MSGIAPSRSALRACQRSLRTTSTPTHRSLSSQCLYRASTAIQASRQHRRNNNATPRRCESTDAAAAAPVSPKIAAIVDQISTLTLLETADLVASLKSRLNIPDMAFAAPAAAGAGAPAAAAAEPEEEAAPAAQEKTLFTLKLQSFDAASKPKIIKEVKSMLGLSLVDSKKFVESVPKVMKEGVPKEEAEKIVATVKALGGVVAME